MITRQDCIILLNELKQSGIDCEDKILELYKNDKSDSIDINILKFIQSNKSMDVINFYEKLRKSYNNKKSKLYINIVKNDFKDPKDILITLSSLNLQIMLFNRNVQNSVLFLKHCRFEEILRCLHHYSKTFDIIPCQKLLNLIKIDLKVLEEINGRNNSD